MIKNITVIGGGSTGHAAAAIYSNKGFNVTFYDNENYKAGRYIGSYVTQPDRIYFPHLGRTSSKTVFMDGHVGYLENLQRGNAYDQSVNYKTQLRKN